MYRRFVTFCYNVIVLQEGMIVEQGTFNDLLVQEGVFYIHRPGVTTLPKSARCLARSSLRIHILNETLAH
jgi:hypothetical protein